MKLNMWIHGISIYGIGMTVLSGAGVSSYDLTMIQDEAVPLAASASKAGTASYFLWTIAVMFLMAAAAVIIFYIGNCLKYRRRYREILKREGSPEIKKKAGWNLSELKRLVEETENRLAEQMI